MFAGTWVIKGYTKGVALFVQESFLLNAAAAAEEYQTKEDNGTCYTGGCYATK